MAEAQDAMRYSAKVLGARGALQTKASAIVADKLRVNPEALSKAANDVANHGESLLAAHQSSHGQAVEAQSGWVGSSAGALSGVLDSWETTTTAHLGRIGEHSCGMHFAAADFTFMEQQNKQKLNEVGQAAHSPPVQ